MHVALSLLQIGLSLLQIEWSLLKNDLPGYLTWMQSQRNADISVIFSPWHKLSDDIITKVMMTNPIELSSVIKLYLFYV